jgi:hypothetical protein
MEHEAKLVELDMPNAFISDSKFRARLSQVALGRDSGSVPKDPGMHLCHRW